MLQRLYRIRIKLILIFILMGIYSLGYAQMSWDLETGYAFSGYNTIRIPGDTGTRLSLTDDLNAEPTLFWRTQLTVPFKLKHSISLLIAPLRITSEGTVDKPVNFNGVNFPANTELTARYRFDSYRIRYRYYPSRLKDHFGFGGALKIRDAAIRLSGGDQTTENTNTGFVPLLSIFYTTSLYKSLSLVIDADMLASVQGRAEDILLAVNYRAGDRYSLKTGYRMLEGGADNYTVYTFALVHYVVAAVTIYF